MEKTVFTESIIDFETGEIKIQKTIKKKVSSQDHFVRAYAEDIGALLKCSKGEIDFIVCCIKLGFIGYDTNELILNLDRKRQVSECVGVKFKSIYHLIKRLREKNLIIKDGFLLYLNPKLIFLGSDVAREKMFSLNIRYEISEE